MHKFRTNEFNEVDKSINQHGTPVLKSLRFTIDIDALLLSFIETLISVMKVIE
jgi:hypothetical protein